jgi:hypothetical protein
MKIKYQNKEVDATEVEVLTSDEHWNTFQLADGKVLMYKEVLVSVLRLEGEFNPDGSQVYQFQTHKVVRIK